MAGSSRVRITKYQNGAGWYVKANNELVGGFKKEENANLFMKAYEMQTCNMDERSNEEKLADLLNEANCTIASLKAELVVIREFLSEQDVSVFGSASRDGVTWPVRDEMIDDLTKIINSVA